jgi:hypothetical protein
VEAKQLIEEKVYENKTSFSKSHSKCTTKYTAFEYYVREWDVRERERERERALPAIVTGIAFGFTCI